ncbi:hypothetical protein JCM10914A_17500 [Paenibacillus sp. JCM 10914]
MAMGGGLPSYTMRSTVYRMANKCGYLKNLWGGLIHRETKNAYFNGRASRVCPNPERLCQRQQYNNT